MGASSPFVAMLATGTAEISSAMIDAKPQKGAGASVSCSLQEA